MSVRLSCPSCNTSFTLGALPPSRRATCPRCGDVFPVRGFVEDENGEQRAEDREQKTESRPTAEPARGLSVPRAVLVAVGLGLVGLAVGLVVYFTREKPQPPRPEPPLTATATPPAQLAGLGYLPAESNVVFAVQPGPIIASAERTQQEPRELLTQAGIPQQVLDSLDQMGLPLSHIDHIAGGVTVGDNTAELRLTFVLMLKQPVTDEEEFLKKLKAKPLAKKSARWSIELAKVPLLQVLAKASPRAWVFGFNERGLAAVDTGGFGPGGTQLRGSDTEGVRKMLASVPSDAAVWLVADDDRDWTQKQLLKSAALLKDVKQWLPALKEGRGGLVAISFGEQPRLRLFVRAADTATAERVRAYFTARAAELESATAGGGGTFALFDAPYDPATSGKLIQRFLEDARK